MLTDLRLLAEHHMLLFKLDFLRRGHIADIMKNELAQKGPLSFAKSVAAHARPRRRIPRWRRATAPGRSCPRARWAAA